MKKEAYSRPKSPLEVDRTKEFPIEVPGFGPATLRHTTTDIPELFPPKLLDRTAHQPEEKDKVIKHLDNKGPQIFPPELDYQHHHEEQQGTSDTGDGGYHHPDGMELQSPNPDNPIAMVAPPNTRVREWHPPGAEHVRGPGYVASSSSLYTAGIMEAEAANIFMASTFVPRPKPAEPQQSLQTRNRKLQWIIGGLSIVLIVVVIATVKTIPAPTPTLNSPLFPSPTSTPLPLNATNATLEALIPFLPESSKAAIMMEGTPQYQALEWISGPEGGDTLSDDRIRQRYVLATLYYATRGSQWTSSTDWLTSNDECNWYNWYYGSSTGCNNNVLTFLDLTSNNVAGVLPADISMLSHLTDLSLGQNSLSGTIPSNLGQLTSLEYLDLSTNSLTGTIPSSIGLLTDLKFLSLYNTTLTGTIPSVVCALVNLTEVDVDCDKVTCGCGIGICYCL